MRDLPGVGAEFDNQEVLEQKNMALQGRVEILQEQNKRLEGCIEQLKLIAEMVSEWRNGGVRGRSNGESSYFIVTLLQRWLVLGACVKRRA